MKAYEGKIEIKGDRILVDAEPYIMKRIRVLFTSSQSVWERGVYTHSPLSLSPTLNTYRDILWIMERYVFDVAHHVEKVIKEKAKEYDDIIKNNEIYDSQLRIREGDLKMAITLRDYQVEFLNHVKKVKRVLNADVMGLGKTFQAASILSLQDARPAIIVVPPTLRTQWQLSIKEMFPNIKTKILLGNFSSELDDSEVFIIGYNSLQHWEDEICNKKYEIKTVIFDEVHELRRLETEKRRVAKILSMMVEYCIGLSGTPIFNYGDEIWSVIDIIADSFLETKRDFTREWCSGSSVNEPKTLNRYLSKMGIMIRREKNDVGFGNAKASRNVIQIDPDIKELKEVEAVAKKLAMSILSGPISKKGSASQEFDWRLRQATGIAKSKGIAEFAKMILNEEEKVIICVWHRAVIDYLQDALKEFKPSLYSGSETLNQKDEKLKDFIKGDSRVLILSLRSGAGIDGLQYACNTIIIGELDWSPHVIDQLFMRIDRPGQSRHVNGYFITINDGSDPFIMETLGLKRSQHEGLIEGKESEGEILEGVDRNRIIEMAKKYLTDKGEEIPDPVVETGLMSEVADAIRRIKLPHNNEKELQTALDTHLRKLLPGKEIIREFRISKRSRIDFMVKADGEAIGIECKVNSFNRPSVYSQVKRYSETKTMDGIILVAPWNGISSFDIGEFPVVIVDTTINIL